MRLYIKVLFVPKILGLLLLLLRLSSGSAQGQSVVFNASVSPASGSTNTSFTYTMAVTNNLSLSLQNLFITNQFSSGVRLVAIGSNYVSTVTTITSSNIVFHIPQVDVTPAIVTLSVTPSNSVPFTNFIRFFVSSPSNSFGTNLVATATNIPPQQADVSVSITGPGPDVYVGDWITFGVTVTNLGSLTTASMVVSNSFLSNGVQVVGIKAINPTNQFANGTLTSSAFTLTNKGSQTFKFTVQPTNAGTLPFSVSLNLPGDTNSANNTAFTNVLVSNFLTNTLTAELVSTQKFNAIIGVMEQSMVLSNTSPSAVPSARVNVSGMASPNRLYNAVGTNNGAPFVVHGAALGSGESVNLLLQFKVPSHEQLTDLTLDARAMTNAANLTPPPDLIALNQTNRISRSGIYLDRILLEFPSTNGRSYTIVYDDDPSFSHPKVVRPAIVAPANWTYWMDYGSPATTNSPGSGGSRFYKVYLNP